MKRRIKISIIAITCFGVLSPVPSFADNPLEKLIPRGTLFKKWKREFSEEFGNAKAKIPTLQRGPTPAVRPDARQQQLSSGVNSPQNLQSAQRQQVRQQPTLATRPLPPVNTQPDIVANQTVVPVQHAVQPAVAGNGKGFGVIVQQAKNGALVVTRVAPQGNAVKAGLKAGDIVKTVGSVKLTSAEEFNAIAQGLKPGDQMEFEIVRRGRSDKMLVQYGDVPAGAPVVATSAPTGPYTDTTTALNSVPSVLDNSAQPAAHLSRLPAGAPAAVAAPNRNERRLNRTIESQRAKMERMEQELEMLRRTTTPAIKPTENNWALPDLDSPE